MKQNLVQLPKTAKFKIGNRVITIRNHQVTDMYGLLGEIIGIIDDSKSDRDTLTGFEKYRVSYEAVVEYCVDEAEQDGYIIAGLMYNNNARNKSWVNYMTGMWSRAVNFSNSAAGREFTDQFIDKIRSCGSWQELYDELHLESKFQKNMMKKIKEEIIQWLKV